MGILDCIKQLCKEKGITMTELERDLSFGKGTIRNWDKSSPSGNKLEMVADYFHVTVDYLLGRDVAYTHDFDVRRIERARRNMPQKEKDKMMKILQASFEEYFDPDFEDDDLDE